MLGAMRSKNNSSLLYVIMGLVALGLVGIGAAGVGGGRIRSIGEVGQEKIHVASYQTAINQTVSGLSQQLGRRLTQADMARFGVQERILEAVIADAALNNEATRMGISIGDDWVRRAILEDPQFQSLSGEFDRAAYEATLERVLFVSVTEYDELLRSRGTRALMQTALAGGIEGGETTVRTLLDFALETRAYRWATVSESNLTVVIDDPSPAEVRAFYDANPDRYMSPLTREITYVWLSPDAVARKMVIPEDELRAAYDDNINRYDTPEERSVDRLIYPDAAAASAAIARLGEGASFEDLVTARGLSLDDVALGDVRQGELGAAGDLVFAEAGPGVIGPVETDLGPALFRINAILPALTQSFEEVRDELLSELAAEQALSVISEQVPEVDDLLAAGATLEEVATETDMELGAIAFSDLSTGGLADMPEFRDAALAARDSDFPEIVDLPDGGVFALRLDEIKDPALIPFESIAAEVAADARAEDVSRALDAYVDELTAALNDGEDMLSLNLAPVEEEPINRAAFGQAISPQAIETLFANEEGHAFADGTGPTRAVIQVTKINAYDPEAEGNAAQAELLMQGQAQAISADMMQLFTTALQEEAGVNLNQSAINQLNSYTTGHGG